MTSQTTPSDFSGLCLAIVSVPSVMSWLEWRHGSAQDTYRKEVSVLGDLETSAHGRKRIPPSKHSRQEFVEALPGYD